MNSATRLVGAAALGWAILLTGGCAAESGSPFAIAQGGTPSEYAEREGALNGAEYDPADWQASVNYKVANRGVGDIKVVVIHTVQGSYAGCISWFKNPAAQVSAHYVVSKTGAITQMVKEKDIAWHVGSENGYTVGIEHEGYIDDPNWVTPQMLDASALLTCYLVKKYQLPATKAAIKGHVELPNQTHTDPGKYWPWDSYIAKVQACVGGQPPPPPPVQGPAGCCGTTVADSGETIIDDAGNDCIQKLGPAASWWTNSKSPNGGACGWGGSMSFTYTSTAATAENFARWRLTFKKAGKYKVEAFVPNNKASAKAIYEIHHAGKVDKVTVDQKPLSDVWADLGTYDFAANCDEYVYAGDNTGQPYNTAITLGIDAVKLTAVGGGPVCPASCDDGKACTDDSCQNGACAHTPNTGAVCWDGDSCTVGEKCNNGACVGGTVTKDCNDNDACTQDGCKDSNCTHVPMNCDDNNACTADSCTASGCAHADKAGGCDDGNACTTGEKCQNGGCAGGVAKLCDDQNPCTSDGCKGGVCVQMPIDGSCDDGDACSESDYCANGLCLAGAAKSCDDGLPCTSDSCANGQCQHSGDCPSGTGADAQAPADAAKPPRPDSASSSDSGGNFVSADAGGDTQTGSAASSGGSSSPCSASPRPASWAWIVVLLGGCWWLARRRRAT